MIEAALAIQPEAEPEPSSRSVVQHLHAAGDSQAVFKLPARQKQEVLRNLQAMLAIDTLVANGVGLCAARKQVAQRYRGARGMTYGALTRKHKVWREGGQKQDSKGRPTGPCFQPRDWRYFIGAYHNGDAQSMLRNDDFCQHVAMLQGRCQRDDTGLSVRRLLLAEWAEGVDIPGVGTVAEFCALRRRRIPTKGQPLHAADYPEGWSPTNLARCVERILGKRKSAKRVFTQRGEHAAMSFWGDQLYRTRTQLRPLELLTCDDVDLDLYCMMDVGGQMQVVKPRALFVLDVGSACILDFGITGAYTRYYSLGAGEEGTKRGLCARHMKQLLLRVLERYGLPKNWQTHFMHENATAKLSKADTELFARLLPIEFGATQMMETQLPGGFLERCGNPKQKGWIESAYRLLATDLNHLPGTVGRRYELTRGDVGTALWRNGKQVASRKGTAIDEALQVIRQAGELAKAKGVEVAEVISSSDRHEPGKLQAPLLKLEELNDLLRTWVERVNTRTQHALEGFGKVIDVEARAGVWIPDHVEESRSLWMQGLPTRQRDEMPIERFHGLLAGQPVERISPEQARVLSEAGKPIKVTGERVVLHDQRFEAGRELIFRDAASAPALAAFNGREKALIPFLSGDGSQVHLFTNDAAMDWVASPMRVGRVSPLSDDPETRARMGEVHRQREQLRREADALMQPMAEVRDARRNHNAGTLQAHCIEDSPAKRVARRIQAADTERAQNDRRSEADFGPLDELVSDEPLPVEDEAAAWDVGELF